MNTNGLSKTEAAARIGVAPSNFARWLVGTWRPSERHRLTIASVCGISVDAWANSDRQVAA